MFYLFTLDTPEVIGVAVLSALIGSFIYKKAFCKNKRRGNRFVNIPLEPDQHSEDYFSFWFVILDEEGELVTGRDTEFIPNLPPESLQNNNIGTLKITSNEANSDSVFKHSVELHHDDKFDRGTPYNISVHSFEQSDPPDHDVDEPRDP